MSLRSVSLDADHGVLLSAKFPLQSPQNAIPVPTGKPIAIVCSHDHAFVLYAAVSVGPSKSP